MKEKDHYMLSPLFSTGVGHAQVHSPTPTEIPDPLGYLGSGPTAPWMSAGRGDDGNAWDAHKEIPEP